MFSRTNFLSIACAIAVFVPAISAWETQFFEHRGMNLTLVRGEVNANSDISKRNNIPPECQFGDSHSNWAYYQFQGPSEDTACFGYDNIPVCAKGRWSDDDPDWTDIQLAMAQQTTLDGQWKGSQSGDWRGSLFLGRRPSQTAIHHFLTLGFGKATRKPLFITGVEMVTLLNSLAITLHVLEEVRSINHSLMFLFVADWRYNELDLENPIHHS